MLFRSNGDINASAAIAGTKISPDFGSQNTTTTGTSTAASFIPSSSTAPTNGLYLPAANSVALATGGSGRLFIDSSGNVGINTASTLAPGGFGYARELGLTGSTSGDSAVALNLRGSRTVSGGFGDINFWHQSTSNRAYIQARRGSSDSAIDLDFITSGGAGMRITSAGLVGIGTSSPESLIQGNYTSTAPSLSSSSGTGLRLRGSSSVSATFGTYPTSPYAAWIQSTDVAGLSFPLVLNPLGGNVGIGTTSPSNLLHLSAAGTSYLQIQNTSAGNNFYVGNSGGTGIFELTGSNQFKFISNSSDRVVIDTSGRLLVGTSSASSTNINDLKFFASGNVKLGSNLTAGKTGGDYDGLGFNVAWQASSGYKYEVSDSAAYIKYGSNNGRIETFTAPAGTAGASITFTTGPYVAQGGTSWTSSSDERLKENLLPIEGALNKINALRAVTGKFKKDPIEKRRAFLIAQDVQRVLPEAVDTTNSESLGLDYSALIPLLVAALKESKERIETLEAKVAALEAA